ncbi:MAG TPA: VCBS repeat-containing protein [Desulfobacteraceae bacterium]|nr:VCBS repeat-containing protein [Desulfobacteraceae bacterium]
MKFDKVYPYGYHHAKMQRLNGVAMIKKILSILFVFLVSQIFISGVHASGRTVVLFPVAVYGDKPEPYLQQGFKSMFVSRLSGEGLEVKDDVSVAALMSDQEKKGIIARERAEEITKDLNAGYAVFGSLTTIAGGYSLDLSVIELLDKGSKLTRVSEAVDENQFIPRLSDVAYRFRAIIEGRQIASRSMEDRPGALQKKEISRGLFSRLGTETINDEGTAEEGLLFRPAEKYRGSRPEGSLPLKMAVMAFDMRDMDGDGLVELLVLGREGLFLYKREGESFALKGKFEPRMGEDFIKVSTGDMDNNGKAEIYLVSSYGLRARTYILEWAEGFRGLGQETGHLRVVKNADGGMDFLLYQGSKVDEFFSGRIYLMDYEGGKFIRSREPLPRLREARFYSLAALDLTGDGEPEWIGLGRELKLHAWDRQGNVMWSGSEVLGGTNNQVRLGAYKDGDPAPGISFEGRILIADINGDGKKNVLAVKNIPMVAHLRDLKIYDKSRLIAYDIEGTELYHAWVSGEIDFCITDMQVDGAELFVAAQKAKIMNVGEGAGRIMWFALQ